MGIKIKNSTYKTNESKGIIVNRGAHEIKDMLDALKKRIMLTDERVAKNNLFIESLKDRYNEYNEKNSVKKNYDLLEPYTFDKQKKKYDNKNAENIENQAKLAANEKYIKKLNESLKKEQDLDIELENKRRLGEEKAKEKETLAEQKIRDEEEILNRKLVSQGIYESSLPTAFSSIKDNELGELKSQNKKTQVSLLEQIDSIRIEMTKNFEESLNLYRLQNAKDVMYNLEKLNIEEAKIKNGIEKYNKQVEKEKAEYEKLRNKKIENLKEKDIEENLKKQKEEQDWEERNKTFRGEKIEEMNQRLADSLNFYKAFPKDASLALIEENSEKLKEYLGVYYDELIKRIKNK